MALTAQESKELAELEELERLESELGEPQPIPGLDPKKQIEDIFLSLGQGVTSGYLPQIAGAIKSQSVSGPQYEKQKQEIGKRLQGRGPIESLLGEVTGGFASPLTLAGAGALRGGATIGKAALVGAGQGLLQSPGGDIGAEQLPKRLQAAALGGSIGGALAGLGRQLEKPIQESAKRRAFFALRPQKAQVKIARRSKMIEPIGETMLEDKIIGNLPVSSETLVERISKAKNMAGQAKGKIIDDIQNAIDEAYGTKLPVAQGQNVSQKAGVDLNEIRKSVLEELKVDPDLPQAQSFNKKLNELLSEFGQGKDIISVKRADELKTKLGKFVRRWYPTGKPQNEPFGEQFHKSLYKALNQGVDDTAEVMAKTFKPDIVSDLRKSKSRYGALSQAEQIALNRVETDFANRSVSPSDYGVGLGAAIGTSSRGESAAQSTLVGAAAASVNNFLRKYGNQISAKQLNNLRKVVGNEMFQNLMIIHPSLTVKRRRNERRIKVLEE